MYGTVTLTATATDATDKPVSGVDVQFSSSSLKNQPAQNTVATDANGQATLALTDKKGELATDILHVAFDAEGGGYSNEVLQWVDASRITLGALQTTPAHSLATKRS